MKKKLKLSLIIIIFMNMFFVSCDEDNGVSPSSSVTYYMNVDNMLTTEPFADTSAQGGWSITQRFRAGSTIESIAILNGNLKGGTYSYDIWAWAVGSSFSIEILILQKGEELILASWEDITTDNPERYIQVQGSQKGPDPTTQQGDTLMLRIAHTGPYMEWVEIRFSENLKSNIKIGQ